jgi:hypothetical protein
MFVAVWMIYAADRLLDARQLDAAPTTSQPELEERHRFHHRHRTGFLVGTSAAAIALVFLLPHLYARALLLYILLAALLGTWMLLIHASNGNRRLPKELAVGIFFPAACFIPTVAHAPSLQPQLLLIAAVFAGVCTLNCLFLYAWEHPTPHPTRQHAHWTTLWSIRHLPQFSTILLLLCIAVASLDRFTTKPVLACAASIVLLLTLHKLRSRIAAVHLRAAADLVLLSPLLFLLHP